MMVATEDQIVQIGKDVRALIDTDPADNLVNACSIQRYFRATRGDLNNTVKRLVCTAQWRQKTKPACMDCPSCLADPTSHYLHLCGFDKLGRPVMYSSFLLAGNRSAKTIVDHMTQVFEMAVRIMPAGVEQWVWLNDFIGFGFADMNPALALSFIDLMARHYPERLGQLLVLDAPSMMTPVWNMVRPLVDPVTHKKIQFLPNDLGQLAVNKPSNMHKVLEELLGEELLTWVISEMNAMRTFRKKQGPRPRYDMAELRACAKEGRQPSLASEVVGTAKPARKGGAEPVDATAPADAADVQGHSHYGCGSLLQQFIAQPDLLFAPVHAAGLTSTT